MLDGDWSSDVCSSDLNAKDLASRDVVSRAMVTEINEGRGCGPNKDFVLLDITHLEPATIMKRLPGIREIAIQFAGVDPIKEPIPVVPTCHYQMGGIPTNYFGQVVVPQGNSKAVVVPGFYAAGECACASVHGANRLGTNSLLDLLVFGKSAGETAVEELKKSPKAHKPLPQSEIDRSLARVNRIDTQKGGANVHEARLAMQRTMQNHCGCSASRTSSRTACRRSSKSRRMSAAPRLPTSRRCSTRRASRPWNWRT
jgi:succinate dehydrogenase / fumarate reductase flavoprotein subunit